MKRTEKAVAAIGACFAFLLFVAAGVVLVLDLQAADPAQAAPRPVPSLTFAARPAATPTPTPLPTPTVTVTVSAAPVPAVAAVAAPIDAPPPVAAPEPLAADVMALVTIPRLGSDVVDTPMREGVDPEVINQGIGHFPGVALPGQPGNFAIAGHRSTHGEELRNIDQLQAGDLVYLRTRDAWFTYRLFKDLIVTPDSTWVVDAKPFPADPTVSDHLLTIVTCNPRWGSTERWIWWGALVSTTPLTGPAPTLTVN